MVSEQFEDRVLFDRNLNGLQLGVYAIEGGFFRKIRSEFEDTIFASEELE